MPFPSKKTPEIIDEVLTRLSAGEPLTIICDREDMPHPYTWNEWCRDDKGLGIAHAQARDKGYDRIALDTLEIADNTGRDTKYVKKGDLEYEVCDTEWVQRSKLRVETRLKLLAKWDPRRYGDKVQFEASGPSGGPIKHQVNGKIDVTMTPQQAAEAYADSLRGDD